MRLRRLIPIVLLLASGCSLSSEYTKEYETPMGREVFTTDGVPELPDYTLEYIDEATRAAQSIGLPWHENWWVAIRQGEAVEGCLCTGREDPAMVTLYLSWSPLPPHIPTLLHEVVHAVLSDHHGVDGHPKLFRDTLDRLERQVEEQQE